MFYYVYILLSTKDNSFYIGFTKDLKTRVKEHNNNKSRATKYSGPYNLVHYEAYKDKLDALHREIYLKSGYGRRTIKNMLANYFEALGKDYDAGKSTPKL